MHAQDDGAITLQLRCCQVNIVNPRTGATTSYIVYELDGAGRDFYFAERDRRTHKDAEGKTVVDADGFVQMDADGFGAALLLRSTYRLTGEGKEATLTADEVQQIPGRAQSQMVRKLLTMSALNEEGMAAEKNESTASTPAGTNSPPALDAPLPSANVGSAAASS